MSYGSDSASEPSIVDDIFDGEQKTVFENKQLVDSNTIVDHNRIYGRDEQLAAEARAFRDTLDGERPPDLLLYGPSGTGKSLTVKAVAEKVKDRAVQNSIEFDFVAVNFKTMESHSLDRAVWKLGHQTAKKPSTATSTKRERTASSRASERATASKAGFTSCLRSPNRSMPFSRHSRPTTYSTRSNCPPLDQSRASLSATRDLQRRRASASRSFGSRSLPVTLDYSDLGR